MLNKNELLHQSQLLIYLLTVLPSFINCSLSNSYIIWQINDFPDLFLPSIYVFFFFHISRFGFCFPIIGLVVVVDKLGLLITIVFAAFNIILCVFNMCL